MSLVSGNMCPRAPAQDRARQPCAACRMLRRRCDSNCVLAPYFPSEEIEKFVGVHKVFGASNVVKMIQMVEESKREDAVKAIIYEATARIRDPVYGSTRPIFHLQKMIQELKMQVEAIRNQVLEFQAQRDQLLGVLVNVGYIGFADSGDNDDDPMFGGGSFSSDDDCMAYDPVRFPPECDWIGFI